MQVKFVTLSLETVFVRGIIVAGPFFVVATGIFVRAALRTASALNFGLLAILAGVAVGDENSGLNRWGIADCIGISNQRVTIQQNDGQAGHASDF